MITYTNQKILHINKPNYGNAYLSVGIDEWIEASKVLKPNTFKVYLYLCSNADGFDLALSRQDVINKLGISLDSYKRAIKELTDKKYIKSKQGNVYDFYTMSSNGCIEAPSMVAQKQPLNSNGGTEAPILGAYKPPLQVHTSNHNGSTEAPSMGAEMPPEINNLYNINNLSNINKDADAKNKRRLEDLTDEELDNLEYDYKLKVKYSELYKKYNLTERIDNTLLSKIFEIKKDREREYRKQEANERLLKNDDNFYVNTNKAEYVKKTEECLPELESLWYM